MKAAIYNPYWESLGGGERYCSSLVKVLIDAGWEVDIQWENQGLVDDINKQFGISLENVKLVPSIAKGKGYELCFWLSDGSIPLLFSKKNFLHFQMPFSNVKGKSLLNRIKLKRIGKTVCNSSFTKNFIDREYGVESVVIYPPTELGTYQSDLKENIIIYVGRFSKLKQIKGQNYLIDVFRKLNELGLKDWRMILAGGVGVGTGEVLSELKLSARGLSIEFVENPTFDELKNLYAKSSIFISAAGFGVDEAVNPEKMEHFGITVVEAMSYGVIPVVFAGGGHGEIVSNDNDGYLWRSKDELVDYVLKIIKNANTSALLAQRAFQKSKKFSYENFQTQFLNLLDNL